MLVAMGPRQVSPLKTGGVQQADGSARCCFVEVSGPPSLDINNFGFNGWFDAPDFLLEKPQKGPAALKVASRFDCVLCLSSI